MLAQIVAGFWDRRRSEMWERIEQHFIRPRYATQAVATLKGHEHGGVRSAPTLGSLANLAIMEVPRAAEDESLGDLGQGAGDNGGDSN